MRRLRVFPDSDRVEQALVEASAHASFIDAGGYCSFSQLVDRCEPARLLGRAKASRLLVRFLTGHLAPAIAAEAFGAVAGTPEFAAALAELSSHLRAQAATGEDLRRAALQCAGGLRARSLALARLHEAVDAALEPLGLVHEGALLDAAARRLEQGLPRRLAPAQGVELRAVHDLFPARLRFLEALARACTAAGVGFALRWPGSGGAHTDVFLGHALRFIEARWGELDADVVPELPETPLAWLGAQLFADEPRAAEAPTLAAFSAATPREEIRELARRVKRLVSAGTPPERLAVCFRDLAADTEQLLEAFEELSVPARARLGVPLGASPVGRLALSLLDLVEDDFPVDGVVAVLQSRYACLVAKDEAESLRWLAQAGLRNDSLGARAGAGAYTLRLEALAQRLQATKQEQHADQVRALQGRVEHLISLGRSIPARGRGVDLLERWWKAVEQLGIGDALLRLEPRGEGLLGREVDRALARDQAAADALRELVESVRAAFQQSGLGQRAMERRELTRWLRGAAAELNLAARGPRTGAVWLLDVRELAGRSFDAVFVGGLVDGRFPGRPAPMPVLSEEERKELNAKAGQPLFRIGVADGDVSLPLRLAEDRLLLHFALSAGVQGVTLSRARCDAAGRELLPSPFLDELARCVKGFRVQDVARSPVPPLDEVGSEGELRTRAALELLCPPQTRQVARDARARALGEALAGEPWLAPVRALAAMEAERLTFFTALDGAPVPPGRFSGAVPESEVRTLLAPLLAWDAEHPTSGADLNRWGNCAFQGLLRVALGLVDDGAPGEEADHRVRGTLWHEVLRLAVPALDEAGVLGQAEAPVEVVEGALADAARKAALTVAARQATGHPALWRLAEQRAVKVLRRFVTSEVALPFAELAPSDFEVAFGTSRAPPHLRTVKLPAVLPGERDVYLAGRFDRVDLSARSVGVVDYKSSRAGNPKEHGEALLVSDFQLPVYLLALRAGWPERSPQAAWVGLRRPGKVEVAELLRQRDVTVDQLLAVGAEERAQAGEHNLANAVHGLRARLERGDFGARPHECKFCSFKPVCRISARRLHPNGGEA